MNPFVQQILGVIIRTSIVWLAGKFGAEISESEATKLAAQIVPIVVVVGWSIYQKYRGRLKLLTAAAAPFALTEHEVEAMVDDRLTSNPSVTTPKNEVAR